MFTTGMLIYLNIINKYIQSKQYSDISPSDFREVLENQNITWNANGTISYVPKRTVIFRRDMSVGSTNDTYVTVPNIPMLVSITTNLEPSSHLIISH